MPVDAAAAQRVRDADTEWGQDLAKALADVKAKLEAANSGTREPLFADAIELLGKQFDAATWLVTGIMTRGGTALIGGEPKTIKTWWACEIAVAVATGTKVFGEFYAERGVVAYFFCEDLDKQVRNRLRALLAGAKQRELYSLRPGKLHVRPRGVFVDVLRDEDLAWIIASCRRIGKIDLLVLDPLRDLHSGEEDKSDSMRDVMRRLRVLGEILGCTVLTVHHTAKATADNVKRRAGQRVRGSSAIHGSIDSGIYLAGVAGDGRNTFRNSVDVEIKGARSAGRFQLELQVDDDEHGEAVKAVGTVVRTDADADVDERLEKQRAADRDKVVARVAELAAKGEYQSRTLLRENVPGVPDKRARVAIDLEIGKRLEVRDVDIGPKTLKARVVIS